LVNAATGSSKNITPNWLIARSKPPPPIWSTWTSAGTKRTSMPASPARVDASEQQRR
jgi:hypothetical protein